MVLHPIKHLSNKMVVTGSGGGKHRLRNGIDLKNAYGLKLYEICNQRQKKAPKSKDTVTLSIVLSCSP